VLTICLPVERPGADRRDGDGVSLQAFLATPRRHDDGLDAFGPAGSSAPAFVGVCALALPAGDQNEVAAQV
jgi:hypothetical protein